MNERHIKEEGLRDWFGKSKSKDGKKGWVNVVTGDSCASDKPGEGIPKCVSSAKRASMSKKERLAAAAAKRREDPGQQQKSGASKPTMVKTDRKTRKEEMEIKEGIRDRLRGAAKAVKKGVEQEKKFQRASGETLDRMKRMTRHKQDKYGPSTLKQRLKTGADHDIDAEKKAKMKEEVEIAEAKDKKGKGSGTKDACYHKVKSRYSVWPSAYASGALVKCRKVGAANWGNKSEEIEINPISFQQFQEKCWKGYEKKGMKTMFGKRYPNCVKKEEVEIDEYYGMAGGMGGSLSKRLRDERLQYLSKKDAEAKKKEEVKEGDGDPCWDTHKQVGMKKKGGKMVPNCVPKNEEVEIQNEGAAWTKKSGKNPSGGLNEKGRKSYEAENPGSDLKRPSKKVGNKRRASFCARMKGMKKKLTSKKTANDPDSRINKSLRAWNC